MFDVIVNPHAARLGRGSSLRDIVHRIAPRGRTHVTPDERALERVAGELVAKGPERPVLLAGGDGTTMLGLSALFRASGGTLPPVGILPGGTVNTVLANIAGRPKRAPFFRELARDIETGRARRIAHATLRIDVDDRPPFIGFIVGAGLVSSFFNHYEKHGARGQGAALGIVLRIFASALVKGSFARSILTPVDYALGLDGAPPVPKSLSLVVASVLGDLGLSMRVTPRAGRRSDAFQVVATTLEPRALALRVLDVLRGRAFVEAHDPDGIDREVRDLELVLPKTHPTFVLDGDRIRAGRLRVSVGPEVTLILPQATSLPGAKGADRDRS